MIGRQILSFSIFESMERIKCASGLHGVEGGHIGSD